MKKGDILKAIKYPSPRAIVIAWAAAAIFIAAAAVMLALGYAANPAAYIIYALAAVCFGYAVYALVRSAPAIKGAATRRIEKQPKLGSLISDYGFRTLVFFTISLIINAAFAVFNAVMGIVTLSVWYGVMACYYIFLGALRVYLLRGNVKARALAGGDGRALAVYKLKIYRLCGILLFALELALAGAVTLMVLYARPTNYSEIMAITSAAYTFYKVIFAIVNIIKVRRLRDPLLQSLRNINLTDAAVSLLSLQVTLVAVFSGEGSAEMNALNAVTGFAVCLLTIIMGIWMIASATRQLKNMDKEQK